MRNFLFFVLVLVLSLVTASYFGGWYDKFSPQESSAFWGLDQNGAISFVGFFVAFVFFVPFIFEILGKRKMFWFLILPALLWFLADPYFIYIPVLLSLVGFILGLVIRKIISKFHHPNPPMIVK